jgi:hypothetical protein
VIKLLRAVVTQFLPLWVSDFVTFGFGAFMIFLSGRRFGTTHGETAQLIFLRPDLAMVFL